MKIKSKTFCLILFLLLCRQAAAQYYEFYDVTLPLAIFQYNICFSEIMEEDRRILSENKVKEITVKNINKTILKEIYLSKTGTIDSIKDKYYGTARFKFDSTGYEMKYKAKYYKKDEKAPLYKITASIFSPEGNVISKYKNDELLNKMLYNKNKLLSGEESFIYEQVKDTGSYTINPIRIVRDSDSINAASTVPVIYTFFIIDERTVFSESTYEMYTYFFEGKRIKSIQRGSKLNFYHYNQNGLLISIDSKYYSSKKFTGVYYYYEYYD